MLAEHVGLALWTRRSWLVLFGDGTECGGVALNGGSLHVVFDATQPAHFFAAARAARTAVNEQGHGRTMAGALFGALAVQHQNPSMHGRSFPHEGRCSLAVERRDAAAQGAFASGSQCHRLFEVGIGHQRAHGSKGLHIVHCTCLVGTVMAHEHGREEGAAFELRADDFGGFGGPKHTFSLRLDVLDLVQDVLALGFPDEGTHPHAICLGVANRGFGQLPHQGFLHRVHDTFRDKNASDSRALLTALHGHFFAHFFDKQVKLRRAWHRIGAQNRRIQGVGLHVERHGELGDARVGFEHSARGGRSREGHHVALVNVVQDVSGGTTNQLERARREDAAFVNGGHHALGEKGGHRGGFDDGRNACQPIDSHFFQHAPDREVEGVDVHSDPLFGDQQVVSSECPLFSKWHEIAVGRKGCVGQLPAKACIGKQIANASFNVDPRICTCGPCGPADLIELLFHGMQVQCQTLQHAPALLKGHGA